MLHEKLSSIVQIYKFKKQIRKLDGSVIHTYMDSTIAKYQLEYRALLWKKIHNRLPLFLIPLKSERTRKQQFQRIQNVIRQLGMSLSVKDYKTISTYFYLQITKANANNSEHVKFFKQKYFNFNQVSCKEFVESNLSRELINIFLNTDCLAFYKCCIGNQAAKIVIDVSQNLKELKISSDPISNIGYFKLLKLQFSNLKSWIMGNTNITKDSIGILKKRIWRDTIEIGFLKQKRFSYNNLLKQLKSINAKIKQKSSVLIIGNYELEYDFFMYWGHISKIFNSSKKIAILSKVSIFIYQSELMIPQKARTTLNNIVRHKQI